MATKTWMIPTAACAGLLFGSYVAYPCVTLYQLDSAVAGGNARALRGLIDWPDVRRGIESDLSSGSDDLPSFGAGFMRTIAVKSEMTPENVLKALHAVDRSEPVGSEATPWPRSVSVEGPFTVVVDLGTVRLRMHLRDGEWRVTRAWLPQKVLAKARAFAQG